MTLDTKLLHSPLPSQILFHKRTIQVCEYPSWKRRRLKINRSLRIRCQLGSSPWENLLQNVDFIAPALGLASGAALYLSRLNSSNSAPSRTRTRTPQDYDIGEWILFTSPTPFNRFVTLRCPSISFPGSELLEDVNERLVKEERHSVRLNSGRIQVTDRDEVVDDKLAYQRLCLSTDDGGVISLDWPANLDLTEEHGLDTTVLIIPGTAEGSADNNIRSFVCECLSRGCFPVVMNPRGCAGSPLTTPRLFTAADSDDVYTATLFINKSRAWTTLMVVGWGYGANMLTKYLAEVGENTPVIAATCIDNPFDLEEATGFSPYSSSVYQNLKSGLQDILRNNKAIFQGRGRGFDVEKALSTTSLRDFEKEISMISYGFDAIEDFYKKSNTRDLVGNLKIPLLFVQNDSGTVPQFSIPRSLIAENPFTSLLLCSRLNSYVTANDKSTISWSRNLAIEWLAAVELGLLKGRHPLLEDVDVTINPSKALALVESETFEKSNKATKLLNLPHLDESDVGLKPGDNSSIIYSRSKGDSQINHEVEEKNVDLDDSSSTDVQTEEVEAERGNVLQTAEVVMNMLDGTMPDTLTEEKKKKVLAAVGRGETLLGALQEAVPEEVRGTLTSAVSGILNNPGSNLKLERILKIVPDAASGFKSKKLPETERKSSGDDMTDSSKSIKPENSPQIPTDATAKEADKSGESNEPATKPENKEQLPEKVDDANIEPNGTESGAGKDESNKNAANSEKKEKLPEKHAATEKADDVNIEKSETGDGGDKVQPDTKAESTSQKNEEQHSPAPDEKKSSSVPDETPAAPSSASETNLPETAGNENQKSEEPNTSIPPLGVSNPLDVFTGMDDSTQVAVNSVFNVLENMINQLEVEKDENVEVQGKKKENDGKKGPSSPQNHHPIIKDEDNVKNAENIEVKGNKDNNKKKGPSPQNHHHIMKNEDNVKNAENIEVKGNKDNDKKKDPSSPPNNYVLKNEDTVGQKGIQEEKLVPKATVPEEKNITSNVGVQSFSGSSKKLAILDKIPKSIARNPYGDSLYKEYLRQYLASKMQYTEPMDIDTTTALFLDYFHEEGQWKLLEQTDSTRGALAAHDDEIIEPSYVIRDAEKQEGYLNGGKVDKSKEVAVRVKSILLDSLKVEVSRRLSAENMEEMETKLDVDINQVADSVSVALAHEEDFMKFLRGEDKLKSLNGERLIKFISSAVDETIYLRKVVPVGLVVGSSMASLKKLLNVSPVYENYRKGQLVDKRNSVEADEINGDQYSEEEEELAEEKEEEELAEEVKTGSLNNNVMVGAVTAALGASALLGQQGSFSQMSDAIGDASMSFETTENNLETGNSDEESNKKTENNIVTSFAEKAMSVAGPVVPTKEDGGVDQERLVAMLAEWGQKGGMMRLVGKLALLWGGLRGATSLTNKLISFLHIAERNLLQRILAFVVMALILWTPVVVPLLPTLVQGWATNTSSNFAEFACVIGLYVSVVILIALWGKRIRNYGNALEQYGLDFTSTVKIKNFAKGLLGGIVLVMLTQSVNVFLGCVYLTLPSTPNSSLGAMEILLMSGKMLILFAKGIFTASGVALVEELFFRSWLPDEIAADLGYHRGIIISGLAFSLFQRSVWAGPGLWLLSLGLAGARERNQGSLSLPIGLRSGMIAAAFTLKSGGFVSYKPNLPFWVSGSNPFEPLSGIVGISFALLFAFFLYPREPAQALIQTPKEAEN